MKKLMITTAICLFVCAVGAAELTNSPVFEVRLVADAPASDTAPMSLVRTSRNGTSWKELFIVEKLVALDQAAIKSANAVKDNQYDEFDVELTLTDKARKRWAAFTRKNIGKRVAIIVFGELDAVPVIKTEIPDGKVWMRGRPTEKETKDLAARIIQAVAKN